MHFFVVFFLICIALSNFAMKLFSKNIQFVPYKPISHWRKLAITTWRTSEEASFYGWMDIDATGIRKVIEEFREEGIKLSPTAIAAKAVAVSIASYPKMNGVIRFGRIYQRESVDIFFQVDPDGTGDTLSGMVIRNCDKKSLREIHQEIKDRSKKIKGGEDDFARFSHIMNMLPAFVIGFMQRIVSFFMYKLNIWSPMFGIPKDAFGSAMVTSVGMLGIQRGFAPLMPFVECPAIIMIGKLEEKAVVKDGKIEIQEVLPICATMDHRIIDGVGVAKMLKTLKSYFEKPY
jgi:pyruvate/2-oxoglutarate dehydrogenase complex dihydrolipoamide acyltransferase (E2) component